MPVHAAQPLELTPDRRSLTDARWRIAPAPTTLPSEPPPTVARLLAQRGITTDTAARAFLAAGVETLADPTLMPGMAAAVEAVQGALQRGEHIRIFGDYDADGITATAVLVRSLSALGGQVTWYVPHRMEDGYGLNAAALDAARADGVALGITVDNGISAHTELAHARDIGLTMIVTDHHEPEGELPPAAAVLNPRRADNTYPDTDLAGVGVAFTLLRALCAARGLKPEVPLKFLDLVAIGTVADVAPLRGENRALVRAGLPLLTQAGKKAGLSALLKAIPIAGTASAGDVGFKIGPRLNAAGRVAFAGDAVRLLLTQDPAEAERLAANLCAQNAQRQEEEARTLEQARAAAEGRDLAHEKVLVLASPDWHPGVIGIVASRLLEQFGRPCALIAVRDGVGRGSARAREPFHLWEALHECKDLLRGFGGHRVAAGFDVDEANIPALREALCAIGARTLTDDDLRPRVEIDGPLALPEVTVALAHDLEALAPFGMGNPTPIFYTPDACIRQARRVGTDGAHLSLAVSPEPTGPAINAIWFRHGDFAPSIPAGARVDLAFELQINTWQGVSSAQLVVKDIRA